MKVIVVDTETTGFGKDSRLVSICWIVYTDGCEQFRKYYIIKPVGYYIPKNTIEIHGITNQFAHLNGVDIKFVINEFDEDILNANILVGHNLNFDTRNF